VTLSIRDGVTEQRQLFPDNRVVLAVFSPILGLFVLASAFGVQTWKPLSTGEGVAKVFVLEILLTSFILCVLGFLAGIVGPDRIRPIFERTTARIGLAVLALFVAFIILLLWNGFDG